MHGTEEKDFDGRYIRSGTEEFTVLNDMQHQRLMQNGAKKQWNNGAGKLFSIWSLNRETATDVILKWIFIADRMI